ncbi:hypothetical protein D3C75_338580 [compost metagenome]
MLLLGDSYERISEVTGRTVATLYNYSKAYREQGIEGLQISHPPGRHRLLSTEQEQQVYEVVTNQTPADQGFPSQMNWTSPLVRKWMEQKGGIRYSDRGTRDLLYRLNLSFTKPTYTLAKADPQKQEEFKETFQELKKLLDGHIDRILFEDESMIWFPKRRQQKMIPTYGKHWRAKLFGTLDYESGEVFCVQEEQYTAKEFLSFLERVLEKYEGDRIVMILDNARIHHVDLIQPFLKEHQAKLTLVYLPPYSPNLNMIE